VGPRSHVGCGEAATGDVLTIGRALTLVVALLSAATPLMRAYCQLTCSAAPDDRQVSVTNRGQACHEGTGTSDVLAPAARACRHHGETPIISGTLAVERLVVFTAEQDVLLTQAVVDVVPTRSLNSQQASASPPERPRRQPDALRI